MRNALFLCFMLLLLPLTAHADRNGPDAYRLGADAWPPYEFVEGGEAFGISSEITLKVLASIDKSVSRVFDVPWKRGLNMLVHGELDMLVSGVKTPQRETVFHYPDEPLMEASWRLFVSRDSSIRSIDDLKGKVVGLVLGYQYPVDVVARLKQLAVIQYVSDNETNIRKLANGRIDALVADHLNGLWIVESLNLTDSILATETSLGERKLYTLFSKETVCRETVDAFSEALVRYKKTPEYRELLARYHP